MATSRPMIMRMPGSRQSALPSSVSGANGSRNELREAIDAIDTCGEFAIKKQYSQHANPGIQIGEDLIALPLDPGQVPLIRDASRQAPFGRGDKTLVDTSVRDTWELDASKFKLINPAWNTFTSRVLQDVSQSLGTSGVTIELYKLLLYEKGSFFKAHKDSEKAPGMIATLSVCLPSRYKGGEVHLSHAGAARVFDTSQSIFDISALAWYADVTHEIKPIQEGHRLVLIYNIVQTGDGADSASFFTTQGQTLHSAIAQLNLRSPPRRLLYLLDHKYSQASLRMDHLKGRDRAVGLMLQDACTKNGWHLFLCNVTKRVSDDFGYRGYGSYDEDEDEDDEDKGPPLGMDIVATCDSQIFASNVEIENKDILGRDPYRGRDADSQSEGEDTGNEGAPIEYRYHDSAVVMVPKTQLGQFFKFDVEMKVLYDLVRNDLEAHPHDPATRKIALDFFAQAVRHEDTLAPAILTLAWRLKEENLFRTAVSAGFRNGSPGPGVVQALVAIVKKDPEAPIDWDKRFGELVSKHESLAKLSQSLDLIKSLLNPGNMQESFQHWRSTIELLTFEAKQSFGAEDHDRILQLATLHWENPDWTNNVLVPKIRDCTNKTLLSTLICSLLQKSREGMLDGAHDIAIALLESCMPKLHLAKINLNSTAGDYNDRSESERFCQLLDNCLLSGLQQPVDELLRHSVKIVKAAPKQDDLAVFLRRPDFACPPTLASQMLLCVCQHFEKSKMPSSEPAQDFVKAMLKKYVLRDLPKYPKQLPGHAHQPRGCGHCKHCHELDEFLASKFEEERVFCKGPNIYKHLQQQLPSDLFQRTVTSAKGNQYSLRVVKLNREHQVAVNEYMNQLHRALQRAQPFRSEYMKELLGTSTYGELVMLDKLPLSGEIQLENEEGSQTGRKRRAGESVDLPVAKR
ncbi:hypothetical protein F5B22DRAFT_623502 [Xylaria bambusicola]|uniref:uncharacterized protein n=1 Tax=Xylaria bambusicola TaxID=326684 RepID=UPI00200775DB|nr:uncharacterized protein F5B22DRAFT_623502 [Xylaria bambusicola]KAI0506565.1 hypothetical protein F5B22DRAFT_623502 [Xylaria bambusicola]